MYMPVGFSMMSALPDALIQRLGATVRALLPEGVLRAPAGTGGVAMLARRDGIAR
jgi:hypothetical protein